MPKILLVEDDNNLREIFEMRLQAEGYQTVTASNGEEGVAVAMREKPDLIIADVMMPKLSGFEMLETLRAAPEMKDVKVIIMTALGQAEDRARGEKLGVVKYLVKSQATLEDFARVVGEVLPVENQVSPTTSNQQVTQTNNQERSGTMDPASNNPTPPADGTTPPAAGNDATNMPAPDMGGQQSAADEQKTVDSQVAGAMGGDSSAPAGGDSGAPAVFPTSGGDGMGGDTSGTSTDAPAVPPATPPADNPPATPPQTDAPMDGSAPSTPGDPTNSAI